MKASKALKRLTHVEDLLGDVMERYSPDSPAIRETLQNAKTAVSRAKDTVSLQQAPPKTTSPQKKQARFTAGRGPRLAQARGLLSSSGMGRGLCWNRRIVNHQDWKSARASGSQGTFANSGSSLKSEKAPGLGA